MAKEQFKGGMHNPFQAFDWYFTTEEVQNSPSIRGTEKEAAITEAEELEHRHAACGFIQEVGMKLKMPQYTIATAIVYFHRFYMRHTFNAYDKHWVGTACLFLAGKAEETPRKLKDAVSMGYMMKYPERAALKSDSEEALRRQEMIVNIERDVLKAILFNMKVAHPYQELIKTVKQMKGQRELAQVAWNLVNDSLRTTCCLRFKPKMVAIASIYLASKMINQSVQLETVCNPNLKVEELEEIGNEILDLYDQKQNKEGSKHPLKNPAANLKKEPPAGGAGLPGASYAQAKKPPPPKPPQAQKPKPPPAPPPPAKKEEGEAAKPEVAGTGEGATNGAGRGTKRPLEET